jgi:membrane-associated phospholipid phosphatase
MDNKPEALTRESGSKDRATPGLVVVWALLVALAFVSIPGAAYLMRGGLQHGPGTLDERVRQRMLFSHSGLLDVLSVVWDSVGSTIGMATIAVGASLWLWRSCGRTAAIIVAAPATAMLLNNVAKHISQRPRPLGGMNHLTTSFPSGHTATSTAVLMTLAFVLRRERIVSWPATVLIGVLLPLMVGESRLYRDAHWATDVIGGWIIGMIVSMASTTAYMYFRQPTAFAEDSILTEAPELEGRAE